MRKRRWLLLIPVSAVLHAVGVFALVWVVSHALDLPVLFVDLSTLDLADHRSMPAGPREPPRDGSGGPGSAPMRGGAALRRDTPERAMAPTAPVPPARPNPGRAPERAAANLPLVPPVVEPANDPPPTRKEPPSAPEPPREYPAASADLLVAAPSGTSAPSRGAQDPSGSRAAALGDRDRPGVSPGGDTTGRSRAGGGRGRDLGGGPRDGEGSALPGAGAGAGPSSAEYGPYLAQWRRRIHENLKYPPIARRRSLTGTVQLDIVIQPNGVLASVQVAGSSSHGILDEAAVEAVRGLPPLPFPSHLPPRPLRARLPIVFDLR